MRKERKKDKENQTIQRIKIGDEMRKKKKLKEIYTCIGREDGKIKKIIK